MQTFPRIMSVLAILCSASAALAADRFDPAARAAVIAPYLDDQTFAVVHADITRMDVAAIGKQVADVAAAAGINLDDDQKAAMALAEGLAARWISNFTKAGGRDLYVVVSVADIPRSGPFVIVPVGHERDPRAIAALFSGIFEVGEPRGDVVFAGSKSTAERLKTMAPSPRPELTAALAAAGDTAVQFVLMPSDDHRRVLREMLPRLPVEWGGFSGPIVADGLLWVAKGVDLAPHLSANVVIQSKDAVAAAALHRAITGGLKALGQIEAVRKIVPDFDVLARTVTPKVVGDQLRLAFHGETLDVTQKQIAALLGPPLYAARESASRRRCMNHLKQLGLAMHNYYDVHKRFPASASYNAEGRKLLSWRVHILPYIDERKLYKEFHLDEPWDSQHNRKLIDRMPDVYACPSADLPQKGMTTYLAPLGEQTVFSGKEGIEFKEITDGTSNTIMLVDADPQHAVIWTKPDDLEIDLDNPLRGLSDQHPGIFLAVYCDVHVAAISKEIDPQFLRALFTRNGGERPGN